MRANLARLPMLADDPTEPAALVRACQAGDAEAWATLVNRYQRLVYAIPRRAGLSDDGVAEVFQRVWVILFEHLDRIEQPERIAAWLSTTARRESWRMLKQERAAPLSMADNEQADAIEQVADPALLPDALIEQLERQHAVREAMGELETRCRTLLSLLFYRDEPPPYAEIAATLGIPAGSIGPTRARCLSKLQRILEEREL